MHQYQYQYQTSYLYYQKPLFLAFVLLHTKPFTNLSVQQLSDSVDVARLIIWGLLLANYNFTIILGEFVGLSRLMQCSHLSKAFSMIKTTS